VAFERGIGAGVGSFVSTMVSIVFDSFSEEECRFASGVQASTVNIGGIFFSFVGGALVTAVWYGGICWRRSACLSASWRFCRARQEADAGAGRGKAPGKIKLPPATSILRPHMFCTL
jgi:MFS family permease